MSSRPSVRAEYQLWLVPTVIWIIVAVATLLGLSGCGGSAQAGRNVEVLFSGGKYNTNTDKPDPLNYQNTAVYIFKDGKGACTITPNSVLRLFDASGQVVRSDWLQVATVHTFAVTPQDQIVIPCPNEGEIRVYNPHTGGVEKRLALGSFKTARYCPSLGKIIVAGDNGIGFLNPIDWSFTPFKSGFNESYFNASTDGTVVVGWHKSDGHWLKFGMNGILQKDFQVLPINAYDTIIPVGRDMLIVTDRTTKSIFRMVLSTGSVIGYNTLPLPGGEQVQGIGQDLSDQSGATLLFAPNAASFAYYASVSCQP